MPTSKELDGARRIHSSQDMPELAEAVPSTSWTERNLREKIPRPKNLSPKKYSDTGPHKKIKKAGSSLLLPAKQVNLYMDQ